MQEWERLGRLCSPDNARKTARPFSVAVEREEHGTSSASDNDHSGEYPPQGNLGSSFFPNLSKMQSTQYLMSIVSPRSEWSASMRIANSGYLAGLHSGYTAGKATSSTSSPEGVRLRRAGSPRLPRPVSTGPYSCLLPSPLTSRRAFSDSSRGNLRRLTWTLASLDFDKEGNLTVRPNDWCLSEVTLSSVMPMWSP